MFIMKISSGRRNAPQTSTAARTVWTLCSSRNVGRLVSTEMTESRGSDLLNNGFLPLKNTARLRPGARRKISEQPASSSVHNVSKSCISYTLNQLMTVFDSNSVSILFSFQDMMMIQTTDRRQQPSHVRPAITSSVADTVCPRPPVTLTFDCLTLKLVCKSHLRWGPSLQILAC